MSSPFKLQIGTDGIAILTFDLEQFSEPALFEFEQILDQVAKDKSIKVMIFRSGRKDVFIAGFDRNSLNEVLRNPAQTASLVRTGHLVFGKLANLPFPTIALINGACLGGGLECALACTYRIATNNLKTVIGLPEVNLGIIPAWGGTQRLPRLIGIENALKIVLTGHPVDAEKAFKLKIVDALVPQNIAEEKALEFARQVITPKGKEEVLNRRERNTLFDWLFEKNPIGRSVLFSQARKDLRQETKKQYPAPSVALNLIEKTWSLPLNQGLKVEQECFIRCIGNEFAIPGSLMKSAEVK